MIIDATNTILGRLASYAAKQAQLGETIDIINCEKAIVSGDKTTTFAEYRQSYNRGTHASGPFIHRSPEKLVKRTIRGMLPYKQAKGKDALDRIKCYNGIPHTVDGKKVEVLKDAMVDKLPSTKYTTIGQISKQLGAKQ